MPISKKKIEEIYHAIHSGSISINDLPDELSKYTYEELIPFVEDGFGKLTTEFKELKFEKYNNNVINFSGAKTFQEVKDLNSFVFNPDGTKRSFKEFKEFANQINEQYNVNWLRAEQDTAFATSQSANKWIGFEEDKDIFPLLQYQTAGDGRVRPEHAAWDNIIRPVNDSFWNTRMPPNSWNCRCTVIQLSEGDVSNLKGVPKNSDEMLNVNPGKTDYIFDEKKHPYFKHTKSDDKAFKKALKWQ